MFWKLAAVILAIGLTACGLLAMRQARLQAAHELAEAELRIAEQDEKLLTLHAAIADRITPEDVRAMRRQSTHRVRNFTAFDWLPPDDGPIEQDQGLLTTAAAQDKPVQKGRAEQ